MRDRRRDRPRGYVSLSPEVYARLKRYAEQQGVTMTEIVEALTADVGRGE